MATSGQIRLISELLDEMGWDRDELAKRYGSEAAEYEALHPNKTSDMIEDMLDIKREEEALERDDW